MARNVYNTGKIKIGDAYTPPVRYTSSRDMDRLQSALLQKNAKLDRFDAVLDYLFATGLAAILTTLALVYFDVL